MKNKKVLAIFEQGICKGWEEKDLSTAKVCLSRKNNIFFKNASIYVHLWALSWKDVLYQIKMLDCKIFGGYCHRIEMDAPFHPSPGAIPFHLECSFAWNGGMGKI